MKLGINIIFHNNANEIDVDKIVSILNEMNKIQFCFVNNASTDKTLDILKQIKEDCQQISIVDIKKYASEIIAVKAGVRFLISSVDLNYLGYVNTENLKNEGIELTDLLSYIKDNLEYFQDSDLILKSKEKVKKSTLKIAFSVTDYLDFLNSNLGLVS